MISRHPDFDHLDAVAGQQHPVADFRRLNETVARRQPDRAALIFVNHIHPALVAINQLKPDLVKMHHIGHRTPVRNTDMRGNDRPAKPRGDQVAVLHPRPPDNPGRLIGQPPHHKGMLRRRQHQGRVQHINLHPRAIGRGQHPRAARKSIRVIGQYPQGGRGLGSPLLHPHPQPMPRKHRHLGVIRRIDHIQPHSERFGEKRQVVAQLLRRQAYFCTNVRHRSSPR